VSVVLESPADRDVLRGLLQQYNERPEQRERIIAEIHRRFRRPLAILVVDSCGFSRTVQARGIVHFLALLERLERLVTPIIQRRGGRVVRRDADNLYAVFPEAAAAAACADSILSDLRVANDVLPAAEEFHVSIGVGYGNVLVVGPDDVYGDEMNLACKLGEDVAEPDEVLLTAAAHAALGASSWQFEKLRLSITGLGVTAYRLVKSG
jgi:adenylate cyclase